MREQRHRLSLMRLELDAPFRAGRECGGPSFFGPPRDDSDRPRRRPENLSRPFAPRIGAETWKRRVDSSRLGLIREARHLLARCRRPTASPQRLWPGRVEPSEAGALEESPLASREGSHKTHLDATVDKTGPDPVPQRGSGFQT